MVSVSWKRTVLLRVLVRLHEGLQEEDSKNEKNHGRRCNRTFFFLVFLLKEIHKLGKSFYLCVHLFIQHRFTI